jgi:hypothetical protein
LPSHLTSQRRNFAQADAGGVAEGYSEGERAWKAVARKEINDMTAAAFENTCGLNVRDVVLREVALKLPALGGSRLVTRHKNAKARVELSLA